MLNTLPAVDSRGLTVVLVNEGMGEEDCDGEDADDGVGDGDDDRG